MTPLTTYIMHHPALKYRKESLTKDLIQIAYPYKCVWVEQYPPTLLYNNHKITPGELSLSLKHYHTFCMQYETDVEYGFYIEDDIDFLSVPSPLKFIEQCIEEMKDTNGDICWIGGTDYLSIREPLTGSNLIYYRDHLTTRCTHGFIVHKKCILQILNNYHFNNQVDIMMNNIILTQKLKNGWAHPFFYQKSHSIPEWKCSVR